MTNWSVNSFASDSIISSKKSEIMKDLQNMNPAEASAAYSKRMAEFQEKLAKQIKETNNNMLSSMLSNINPNCTNYWNTKYAKNDIESLQYYLGCCNGNCDSSIQSQISALKEQEPVLSKKLEEFKQNKDNKDSYTLQIDKKTDGKGLDLAG